MPSARSYDAIIAGAAGMFRAAIAGQRGRKSLLIDHNPSYGARILIAGGGRCNFTNIGAGAANSTLATRISPSRLCRVI